MKKQITTFLIVSMLAIMAPIAASAQPGRYCAPKNTQYRGDSRNVRRDYRGNSQNVRYYNDEREYNDGNYYNNGVKRPNVYDRHRKAVNLAVGAGGGALLGALIGGKKGALIGGAAGLAGGAIVTKKQRPRNYYRAY